MSVLPKMCNVLGMDSAAQDFSSPSGGGGGNKKRKFKVLSSQRNSGEKSFNKSVTVEASSPEEAQRKAKDYLKSEGYIDIKILDWDDEI